MDDLATPMGGAFDSLLAISVIIPAYTDKRWTMIVDAIDHLTRQTHPPTEILLAIDRNKDLYARCRSVWPFDPARSIPIRVVLCTAPDDDEELAYHARAHGSRRRFGAGAARNVAADEAIGDLLLFQDDDATAAPDWIERVVEAFEDDSVVAVGGAPLPRFETARPRWMPVELDWVFGCAYVGLPATRATARHLIGANLSVRHDAFDEIGGFHSTDFDDLDLCHRLAWTFPDRQLVYEPRAVVRHFVPAERVSWSYFWRRPFYVNRAKVIAFEEMGSAANLAAERAFVARSVIDGGIRSARELCRGDRYAPVRFACLLLAIVLAGAGHIVGRLEHRWRVRGRTA